MFIYGDYMIDNVFVYDGWIIVVIDWSGGIWGDVCYDMVFVVCFEDGIFIGKECVCFFKGYGKGIL